MGIENGQIPDSGLTAASKISMVDIYLNFKKAEILSVMPNDAPLHLYATPDCLFSTFRGSILTIHPQLQRNSPLTPLPPSLVQDTKLKSMT